MMEFPDETADPGVSNLSEKLTLEEKIESKNWKVRVDGYEQLRAEIPLSKDNKEFLRSCGTFINKITAESNPNGLDIALDISILFFELCDKALEFCDLEKIFGNVVDKTFGARQSTLQRGKALILKIIETSDPNQLTLLLLSKLNDKRPKVPGVCLDLLNEGFILFGGYNFPVKDILKAIPNVFNSSNSSARESAMSLIVELHRWIGQAPLQSLLETLRPAQQNDFEKLVATKNTDSNPIPTLGLRKDRLSGELTKRAEKPMQVDARELVDEVDLAKKLKGTEFSTLIASDKWADQVQGLDILIQAIGPTPKIKYSTAVHDVLSSINELLKNGHVQVQIKCLRILSLMADGSRSKIQTEMRNIIGTVLSRSKEKKIVAEVAEAALLIFQHCVTFDFLVEDVMEILNNKKSPAHAKLCLSQVIESLVEKSLLTNQDTLKLVFQSFVGNSDDPDPKVREISTKCLQTMKDHFDKTEGKSPIATFLNGLQLSNPKLFKKISSQSSTDPEKKIGEDVIDVRKSSASVSIQKPVAQTAVSQASLKPQGKPLGSDVGKAPSKPNSQLKSSEITQKKASKTSDSADDDVVEDSTLSLEDAVANLSVVEGLNWDVLYTKIQSQKWQDKVEAFASLQDRANILIEYLEAFHVVCVSQGIWKSSNVNVVKGAIDLYAVVFAACVTSPPRSLIAALITSTLEKLADKKLQKPIETLFEVFLLKSDPKFVFKRFGTLLANAKSPLVHQNLLAWMKVALSNLRNSQIPLLIICQTCLKEMENKSGAIRTGAIDVLCLLYSRIGPPFSSCVFTKDLNPQLKSTLEQEFAKVEVNIPQEISGGGNGDENLDIPRKDLNELVDKGIVNDLNCLDGKDSWQVRKAAMEKILEACNISGHYIEFNKTSTETLKQLKQRLSDTQSNLKVLAIQTISHLIASFSAEKALKAVKPFIQSILLGLTDNKKPMRDATVCALDTIAKLNGETLNGSIFMCIALSSTEILNGSIGRLELLTWLNSHAEHFSGDCSELALPLLNSLQDKTSGVRLEAESLYISLYSRRLISKTAFEKATRDLSPATKRAIQNVLDRISASAHTKETVEDMKQTIKVKETKEVLPVAENSSPVIEIPSEYESENRVSEKLDRCGDWAKWPVPPLQPSLYDFSVLKNKWKTEFPTAFLSVILESGELSEHLVSNIFATYSAKDLFNQSDYFFRWVSYQLTLVQEMGKMKPILSFLHHFFWKCNEMHPKFDAEELNLFLPHFLTKIPYMDKVEIRSFEELISDISGVFDPSAVIKILSVVWAKAEVSSRIIGWNCLERILQSYSGRIVLVPSLIESLRKDYLSPEEKKKCEKILVMLENDSASQNVSGFSDALKSLLKPKSQGLKQDVAKKSLFSWLLEDLTIAAQSTSQIPTSKCRDIADITRLILEDRTISEPTTVTTHLKEFFDIASKLFQQCARIEVSVIYSCLALVNFYSQFSLEVMDELPYQTINNVITSLLNCLNLFGEEHLSTTGTLWRAINITLLQFALSANSILSLTVLLETMNRDFQYQISLRLGLAVLDKEKKNRTPFDGSDDMISEMLLRLNELLSKQNHNFGSNAKFSKLIYGTILTTLSEDRISRLNLNGCLPYEYLTHATSLHVGNQENAGENIVKIINEITFSKEKRNSISKLYAYQRAHPEIDLNDYLSKLSTPFQKYVHDMFSKLKEEEENQNQNINENRTPFKVPNEDPIESDIQTNEAFRIIENLKSRPTSYRQLTETPVAPPVIPDSPFSRRNDKIRDSLSTLSKSLDLQTSFNEGSKTPFSESLEERLARLKNLK